MAALPGQTETPTPTTTGSADPSATATPSPSSSPNVTELLDDAAGALASGNWWLETFLPVALRVGITIFALFILRWVITRTIRRAFKNLASSRSKKRDKWQNQPERMIQIEREVQRTDTIGKLIQSVVTMVIFAIGFLLVLAELGFNLAPLIAGIGIFGAALAFGGQSLIADFVNGVFLLIEDQFGVGDVVDLGDAIGTVEHVSLRVTQVRGVDGTLWFVRNGEVVRVGNKTQDWSRTVLDVGIAYGADVDQARDVMNRCGTELAADPEFADLILEDPSVWGVEALGADSVLLRMVVKTKPGKQWVTSRALNERIKYAFDAAGIEIPFPQRTLWLRQEREVEETT